MLDMYREVWAVDFEFMAPPGERPDPVCLVARELKSGKTIGFGGTSLAPFHHIQSTPTVCLLRTTPAQNLVATWRLAGQCPRAFLTCSPNFGAKLMACQQWPAAA